jgi:hypothetical protein
MFAAVISTTIIYIVFIVSVKSVSEKIVSVQSIIVVGSVSECK